MYTKQVTTIFLTQPTRLSNAQLRKLGIWWVVSASHKDVVADSDKSRAFGKHNYHVLRYDEVYAALDAHNWKGGMYRAMGHPFPTRKNANEVRNDFVAVLGDSSRFVTESEFHTNVHSFA